MLYLTDLSTILELAQADRVRKHGEYMRTIGESVVIRESGHGVEEAREEYEEAVRLCSAISTERERLLRDRETAAAS